MRKPIKNGSQVFYSYGNRTNAFLLINYGFCISNNPYESYKQDFRLDIINNDEYPDLLTMLDVGKNDQVVHQIRFKKNQFDETLMSYIRSCFRKAFIKET